MAISNLTPPPQNKHHKTGKMPEISNWIDTIKVFRNEILTAWQKCLNVEVILISEFVINEFRNKNHFYIHAFLPGCQYFISKTSNVILDNVSIEYMPRNIRQAIVSGEISMSKNSDSIN